MAVHGIHQYRHILRRGKLADTVPQVENMGRPLALPHVRLTKTVQHGLGLLGHLLGRGEKHIGVEIALNGMGRAELRTRFTQIDRPIHSQNIAVQCLHFIHPQTAPFGEYDTGYGVTVKCFVDLGQHSLGVSQAERSELGVSQHPPPQLSKIITA